MHYLGPVNNICFVAVLDNGQIALCTMNDETEPRRDGVNGRHPQDTQNTPLRIRLVHAAQVSRHVPHTD
jgi:hypothetical protein